MAWVTWRQHRLTLAGVVALFGAAAVYLLITGLQMHHAYAAVSRLPPGELGSLPAGSRTISCDTYAPGAGSAFGLLQVIPALIGAFAGAPLLARELETGTFRYAWTQGFGRARWTVAKLVPLAVAVTVAAGAFSVLVSWYVQPILGAGDRQRPARIPPLFDLRGVALAAWTLAAFAIGVLAGILIRRVIPAMFATLAAWAGLAFATGAVPARALRGAAGHQQRRTFPLRRWVINQGWFKGGKPGEPGHDQPDARSGRRPGGDARTVPTRARDPGQPRRPRAVPHPARLHAVDDLPAGQPVLAVPVDRRRLAPRALRAPHRDDRLAGPPPRGLRLESRRGAAPS